MTSREIEDVLSSIRRLVSEDLRPPPRGGALPLLADPEPEKLILTPALRIVSADEDDADHGPAFDVSVIAETGAAPPAHDPGSAAPDVTEAGTGADMALGADPFPRGEAPEAGVQPEVAVVVQEIPADHPAADEEPQNVVPGPGRQAFPVHGAAAPDPFADDDPVDRDGSFADAEVLRELVRDLLREELRGALGERITGNIRKLVRAEIARALAAQALD